MCVCVSQEDSDPEVTYLVVGGFSWTLLSVSVLSGTYKFRQMVCHREMSDKMNVEFIY
jgi:hypothetical protein